MQRPLQAWRLIALGVLAVSILIIGLQLQNKFQRPDPESAAETQSNGVKVSEGSPSLGIASRPVTPQDRLSEIDEAIAGIVQKSSQRIYELANGGVGFRFIDSNMLLALGASDNGIGSEVFGRQVTAPAKTGTFTIRYSDPVFSLSLLSTSQAGSVQIDAKNARPGEILIGIQTVPELSVWVTRMVTTANAALGPRWYEQIITSEPPPPNFSGVMVNSSGRLMATVHKGVILSRAFLAYWAEQAVRSPSGFAALPARVSAVDDSLTKYLGITGLVIDEPINSKVLQPGDILVRIAEQDVSDSVELAAAIRQFSIGQSVPAVILRNNEKIVIDVTLIDAQALAAQPRAETVKLSAYLNRQSLQRGAAVLENIEQENPLYRAGLRSGDRIITINHTNFRTLKELNEIIAQSDRPLLLQLATATGIKWIVLPRELIEIA